MSSCWFSYTRGQTTLDIVEYTTSHHHIHTTSTTPMTTSPTSSTVLSTSLVASKLYNVTNPTITVQWPQLNRHHQSYNPTNDHNHDHNHDHESIRSHRLYLARGIHHGRNHNDLELVKIWMGMSQDRIKGILEWGMWMGGGRIVGGRGIRCISGFVSDLGRSQWVLECLRLSCSLQQ